jgi:hypothetical protein
MSSGVHTTEVHHSGEKTSLGESEADADADQPRVPAALRMHFCKGLMAEGLTRPIGVTIVPQKTVMNGRKRDGRKRFKSNYQDRRREHK